MMIENNITMIHRTMLFTNTELTIPLDLIPGIQATVEYQTITVYDDDKKEWIVDTNEVIECLELSYLGQVVESPKIQETITNIRKHIDFWGIIDKWTTTQIKKGDIIRQLKNKLK